MRFHDGPAPTAPLVTHEVRLCRAIAERFGCPTSLDRRVIGSDALIPGMPYRCFEALLAEDECDAHI